MSTTRHLINRRRRLATAQASRLTAVPPPPGAERPDPLKQHEPDEKHERPGRPGRPELPDRAGLPDRADRAGRPEGPDDTDSAGAESPSRTRPRRRPLAALGVLTVLLGGFAAWATAETAALRDTPSARNTALTDIARTSEVKGRITKAVGELFSFDYAATASADRAARTHLTGKAVEQHRAMLAPVRARAAEQKPVLTTTVTHSGVELIDGDRARVLVYADQNHTRTAAKKAETAHGAAMFAVEAVRKDGAWRIAVIDTLGAGS
ncbi:hypothetical protein [Streptomyces gobitricini]|uniref:Membrane protein n=1 Tax=Streptomyces gobitricini TaxID=68211 RepID=A0ABP6AC21_9ACTN